MKNMRFRRVFASFSDEKEEEKIDKKHQLKSNCLKVNILHIVIK